MPATRSSTAAARFVAPPPPVITPASTASALGKRPRASSSPPPAKKKRNRKRSETAIPVPTPTVVPSSLRSCPSQKRGVGPLRHQESRNTQSRLKYFMKFTQVIRVPYTLETLKAASCDIGDLEKICEEELGPSQPAQCMSARFVGEDGETLLLYFGRRIRQDKAPEPIDLKDQYSGRTIADYNALTRDPDAKQIFDGLHKEKTHHYYISTQNMASKQSLHSRQDATRHEGSNSMVYVVEERPGYDDITRKEDAGVLHLVHGWIQQGQKKKGLYISGDIARTSTTLGGMAPYYELTRDVAVAISQMFEAGFPDIYQKYRRAFDAGVWIKEDPGPFLGRAIIFKLQGKLHKDRKDLGPSACFPTGFFDGGEMLFPQFKTKLLYEPGAVCIFYSSLIYHKVGTFIPHQQTPMQKAEKVTPGRIGTVMFFPKESYDLLKDKYPGWGRKTNFGKDEHLFPATHSGSIS